MPAYVAEVSGSATAAECAGDCLVAGRDEPTYVRLRVTDGRAVPDLFLWRDRLWQVRQILSDRAESTEHRCGQPCTDAPTRPEHVWQVAAADGRAGIERLVELVWLPAVREWCVRSTVGVSPDAVGV